MHAQGVKNKIIVNGSLHAGAENYRSSTSYSKHTVFEGINLNTGYYLTNNFALGFTAGHHTNFYTINNSSAFAFETKNTTMGYDAGIFSRYTIPVKTEKFGIFLQLSATYNYETEIYRSTRWDSTGVIEHQTGEKNNGIAFNLSPGILYFINSKCSLELSAGKIFYDYISNTSDEANSAVTTSSDFKFDFSMPTVFLGFSYYFGGKKDKTEKNDAN
jgi:hypothetical protein